MDRVPSLSAVIWLTAVWVFLWGDLSWGNVVNGVLLACFVHIMFPMPTVARTVPGVRPLAVVILVARFLYDVVVSSVIVAKVALRKRPPQAAVIKVQLRSHNDMVLATVSGLTTLIPGSVVIEAHRLTGVIYIHVFDVPPRKPSAYLDGFRRTVLAQEERVMRAFSSDAELMDVYISDTISPHNFTAAVNRQMPAGMEIMNTYQVDSTLPSLQAQVTAAEYAVEVPSGEGPDCIRQALTAMLAREQFPWQHERDTGIKSYDLRPLIEHMWLESYGKNVAVIGMRLVCGSRGSGRPEQVVKALGLGCPRSVHRTRLILKTS